MKKLNIKILIAWILFIVFFVLNFSFASTTTTWSNFNISNGLQAINDLLKGVWMLLAIITWKLYTNDLLYWTSIHLDNLLWYMWEFSRTMANFIIWFILIVSIFLMFFWKIKNILSTIWKLALASILVNASWFIIAVVIDISTVLLVAVWSFPLSLLWKLPTSATKNLTYCVNPHIWFKVSKDVHNPIGRFYTCNKKDKKTINKPTEFLEKMNNMTWPLFYMWASILNIDKNFNVDTSDVKKWDDVLKTISISFVLQFVTIVLFVVPIILLIIIWIIRIFWIWLYIVFSPLIFLDQVFWWKVWTKHKAFVFKNMVWLIFQPVLVVFALWVSLIFLVSLQSAFLSNWNNDSAKKALWVCWTGSLCVENDVKIVTIKWNLINNIVKDSWWVFGYMILTILSIMLLWAMIRLSFKSSEITSSISDSVYKFTEESLKTVPIIPTPYWWVWLWAMEKVFKKNIITRWLESKAAERSNALTQNIYSALGIKQMDLTSWEVREWEKQINAETSYKNIYPIMEKFIQKMKNTHPWLIPASSPNFQKVISTYINKLWNTYPDIYNLLWLKDKEGKANITDSTKMFEKQKFKEFLTSLITDPEQLNTWQTPINLIHSIKKTSPLLNSSLKDIK